MLVWLGFAEGRPRDFGIAFADDLGERAIVIHASPRRTAASRGAQVVFVISSPSVRRPRTCRGVLGASMSLFDSHTFGPGPGDRAIERPQRPSEIHRSARPYRPAPKIATIPTASE
jgi:hypothetical protein